METREGRLRLGQTWGIGSAGGTDKAEHVEGLWEAYLVFSAYSFLKDDERPRKEIFKNFSKFLYLNQE